jgi:hypothetical protein
MNAHSVAKLYFIKDDPANVRELSALIPVQKIVLLSLFAAFLCDEGLELAALMGRAWPYGGDQVERLRR